MVGVPTLHIFYNLIFGEGPHSEAGNHVIKSETVHHSLTMIAYSTRGGMGDPLVYVANGLVFYILPRI